MSTKVSIPDKLVNTIDCKQAAVRAIIFNGYKRSYFVSIFTSGDRNYVVSMFPKTGTTLSLCQCFRRWELLCVTVSGDGNYFVSCGSNKSLKLWSAERGLLLKTYTGHGYEVLSADCSCDNSQMCSGGMDKVVIVWDVSSGKMLRKYRSHAAQVNSVQFNEDSSLALSGSLDGTLKVWDTRSRSYEPVQTLDEAKDSVTSLQVSNYEILTGSADCRVRRYDLRAGQMQSDYVGKMVSCVKFTKDGQCILVGTVDGNIRLLDKDTGELLNTFTGHKNVSYKLDSCLSSADSHVLGGSEDGKVYVWDLVEAKITHTLNHVTTSPVHSLSYHPTDVQLLTAAGENVFLWKTSDSNG